MRNGGLRSRGRDWSRPSRRRISCCKRVASQLSCSICTNCYLSIRRVLLWRRGTASGLRQSRPARRSFCLHNPLAATIARHSFCAVSLLLLRHGATTARHHSSRDSITSLKWGGIVKKPPHIPQKNPQGGEAGPPKQDG